MVLAAPAGLDGLALSRHVTRDLAGIVSTEVFQPTLVKGATRGTERRETSKMLPAGTLWPIVSTDTAITGH
jgi:hypothetical protein